eukprot:TRINITY_DN108141_c0_g1_i1.p1 TRINITY_DN108141_c0_g1~~TRINITY_DN108141_c0_g1_i1.p1  ORF type:complete len:477 (-),score=72.41 TRINITY_DN108141_c0_g1_i1:303-1733(-)
MGCGASSWRRDGSKVQAVTMTGVTPFSTDSPEHRSNQTMWAAPSRPAARKPSMIREADEFRVLRKSDLSGHVTLFVAGGKHKKPVQYASQNQDLRADEQPHHSEKCPFCVGNEAKTPKSVLEFGKEEIKSPLTEEEEHSSWLVRVFPNIFPTLICPVEFYGRDFQDGLDDLAHSVVAEGRHANHKVSSTGKQVDAIGVSEVVVESPVHNALLALQKPDRIALVLRALVSRGKEVTRQSWAKQIMYFKQYGPLSGGSLIHPHTQILSLPIIPPPLLARLEYSLHAYETNGQRCAVCQCCVDDFLNENDDELSAPSAGSRHVHTTQHFVVSVPYAASSQYVMQIAPKRHMSDFLDSTPQELADLAEILSLLSQVLYASLHDPSYNMFIRSAPSHFPVFARGREITEEQTKKCFHWIVEVRPRFPADVGGLELASGVRVVSGLPENHAAELREFVADRFRENLRPLTRASYVNDVFLQH